MTGVGHPADGASPYGLAVRAGPLSAQLVDANLRCVRVGDLDLVQRIYVGVRDAAWNVILPHVRVMERTVSKDRFEVRFHARHRDGDLDFGWTGWITGSSEGQITYRMEGKARSAFLYNKIGLLVLHPVSTHAGRTVRASGGPGGPFVATFPHLVGPQTIREGRLQGIFPPFRSISIELDGGVLDLDFEGDDFEIEDERNWTESGFKSYSGPLARPWPVAAEPGAVVRQSVTVSYRGAPRAVAERTSPSVSVGGSSASRPPLIGHSVPGVGRALSTAEATLLRLARPSFLQADLRFADGNLETLERVASTVAAVDRPLLASLYLGTNPLRDIEQFTEWCASTAVSLEGVVLFAHGTASVLAAGTPAEAIAALLPTLRAAFPGVPIAVGSDRFLSEVIRSAPTTHGADAIAFGISPSGHADEDWSIVENLQAQGDAVRTLRAHLGTTPVIAGPITLQTRYGAWPRHSFRSGDLPPQVDVRQRSLLAAAWTLGSVRQLALADATLAIYYETVGWRGLFERESGSAMPSRFPSTSLEVFPVLHVFADLGELRGSRHLDTDLQGDVVAMAFGDERPSTVLVASLSPIATQVRIGPLPGPKAQVRILDRRSLAMARRAPAAFRERRAQVHLDRSFLSLPLGPYAYGRIDIPFTE